MGVLFDRETPQGVFGSSGHADLLEGRVLPARSPEKSRQAAVDSPSGLKADI